MRHHLFSEPANSSFEVAVLINGYSFYKHELMKSYIEPLALQGVATSDVVAFTLDYDKKKPSAGFMKEYLDQLMPELHSLDVRFLYVADSNYFKVLVGVTKADPHQGYALPCKIKGYEHMTVVLGINYRQLIFNPDLQPKLDAGLAAVAAARNGTYQAPGQGIIHSARYPRGTQEVAGALQSLHQYQRLTCDIEAFSLDFDKAGIGTIAFAWDKHNGLAFAVDYKLYAEPPAEEFHGWQGEDHEVRKLLLQFFMEYRGELIFHNAGYDVKVLIFQLWMKHLRDTKGLLTGLDLLCKRLHDTKIITYLATNSTAGNTLGLKPNAHEFAGNWAVEEIKDIRRIPLDKLLQYNLVDALSTWYVYEKNYPRMVADQQEALYKGLMLDSVKMLIQVELSGLPMSRSRIAEVKAKLEGIRTQHHDTVVNSSVVAQLNIMLRRSAWEKDFEGRKAKAKKPDKIMPKQLAAFDGVEFNPNSGPQLQRLLYELMGLPVIDYTDTKAPATGAETIKKLINHTNDPAYKAVLEALIAYGGVDTILTTFIPSFEEAIDAGPINGNADIVWLHGNFNLGGTVSGRLSSSDPNLTNIPAKVQVKVGEIEIDLGKLVKYCFVSPPGWIFAGADFNSLEDYISALTTQDPNKLKVYIEGFDGHCLRAAFYYKDELISRGLVINTEDPESVNSLKKLAEDLRQASKKPTFTLTYRGTKHTLMANLGWSEEKAARIEANYHEMYKVSDQWVDDKLLQASKDGYVTVAFGLRVRTPLLGQVIYNGPKMPHEAAAEGRTAGNALGQSYCMLTMRAAVDFMQKVWVSPYRYRIHPVALIHDAIYLLIEDDIEVMDWANRELISSMRWQELPEIQHDKVKIGAALDVFWPDWAHAITLPNDASRETIINICTAAKETLLKPKH